MKDNISITVPMEYRALTRASDFLHGLAQDAKVAGMQSDSPDHADGPVNTDWARGTNANGASTTAADNQNAPDPEHEAQADDFGADPAYFDNGERDPSAAFGSGAADATTAAGPESAPHAETTAGAAATADTQAAAPSATAPDTSATNGSTSGTDLDLDADGLPWDARIHSSSKKKLAKTKQWKKRRKPNDQAEEQWQAYVDSVEAELRRVMQAGPHAPIEETPAGPTPPPAEQPAGPTPPPAAEQPAGPTPPPAAETVEINTLPELFRYITDNNVSDEKALAAVRAQGIESFALLGARPDLVPAVAKALQEG